MAARALLTGASGLIGRHVVHGWDLADIRLIPIEHIAYDLLVPGVAERLIDELQPDVVIHLAWCASGTDGYRTAGDNERWVSASSDLARASTAAGAWFIGTGTGLDAGPAQGDLYGESKARLRGELQSEIDGGVITWLRPYYVVDPIARRPAVVAEASRAQEQGSELILQTPDALHDFIHAGDVGAAIRTVVSTNLRGAISIGSGELHSVSALVERLGVKWISAARGANQSPQYHDAAEVAPLRAAGWIPIMTRALFAS